MQNTLNPRIILNRAGMSMVEVLVAITTLFVLIAAVSSLNSYMSSQQMRDRNLGAGQDLVGMLRNSTDYLDFCTNSIGEGTSDTPNPNPSFNKLQYPDAAAPNQTWTGVNGQPINMLIPNIHSGPAADQSIISQGTMLPLLGLTIKRLTLSQATLVSPSTAPAGQVQFKGLLITAYQYNGQNIGGPMSRPYVVGAITFNIGDGTNPLYPAGVIQTCRGTTSLTYEEVCTSIGCTYAAAQGATNAGCKCPTFSRGCADGDVNSVPTAIVNGVFQCQPAGVGKCPTLPAGLPPYYVQGISMFQLQCIQMPPSVTPPTPAKPCAAQPLSWGACGAPGVEIPDGTTITVSDTTSATNTGSASYTCSGGVLSAPSNTSCTPIGCPLTPATTWTDSIGTQVCSISANQNLPVGATTTVSAGSPSTGSAKFTCPTANGTPVLVAGSTSCTAASTWTWSSATSVTGICNSVAGNDCTPGKGCPATSGTCGALGRTLSQQGTCSGTANLYCECEYTCE